MVTRILIIRHGESIANREKFFAGQSNVMLSPLGLRQADAAASAMKNVHIDKVFSSPLDRAYFTALPFAKDRGIEVDFIHDFIEMDCGIWTEKTFAEIEEKYPEERRLWKEDPFNFTVTNGEASLDIVKRVGSAVDSLAKANNGLTVLVASHGGAIRTLPYCFAKEKSAELFNNTPIPTNCSITEIIYENNMGKLVRYSDDSYLKDLKSGAFII